MIIIGVVRRLRGKCLFRPRGISTGRITAMMDRMNRTRVAMAFPETILAFFHKRCLFCIHAFIASSAIVSRDGPVLLTTFLCGTNSLHKKRARSTRLCVWTTGRPIGNCCKDPLYVETLHHLVFI